MRSIAKGDYPSKSYWDKIKIEFSKNEIMRITSNLSAKFLVIQYYINKESQFINLENDNKIIFKDKVDVHHIFPSNYLKNHFGENSQEYDFSDSILNKIYLSKVSNIKISDKKPSDYLNQILKINPKIKDSLKSHSIPDADNLVIGKYDNDFIGFLDKRYMLIESALINLKKTLSNYQT